LYRYLERGSLRPCDCEVVDLPDNEAAAAVSLIENAAGGATVKTTALLTPEQVDEAANRAVNYRPPGL
jgi:hypothetical protein